MKSGRRRLFANQPASSRRSGGVGRTVMVGLVGAFAGAFVMLLAAPSDLFGRVPVPSGTLRADVAKVAVIDGDTLRLGETVVRLQGVEAPPRGRQCRRPDGGSFDCGAAAAEALAAVVRNRDVTCHLAGRDSSGFVEGLCEAGDTEINRHLVTNGWARARADAPTFGREEQDARAGMRGLWRDTAGVF